MSKTTVRSTIRNAEVFVGYSENKYYDDEVINIHFGWPIKNYHFEISRTVKHPLYSSAGARDAVHDSELLHK